MKDAMLSSCAEQDAFRLDAQLLSDLWVFRAAARIAAHEDRTGVAGPAAVSGPLKETYTVEIRSRPLQNSARSQFGLGVLDY